MSERQGFQEKNHFHSRPQRARRQSLRCKKWPTPGTISSKSQQSKCNGSRNQGWSKRLIAVARFLDMPRRIAQERVPTASNVGSRDATWTSRPTPLIPFRVFSRVSRAPFLSQSGVVTETQFLIGLGPTRRDRSNIAVARFLDMPRRIAQERVPTAFKVGSRDVTWTSRPTPLIPFRVFSRVSRAPFYADTSTRTAELT